MKRIIPLLSILIATAAHAAGPQPGANPWDWGNYPGLAYSLGGIVLPSTVAGGQKGVGTINAQGYFYNGQPMPTLGGSTPTVGHCLQWGTNGIIDAGGVCTTGGGGGTVTSSIVNYLAYYATTGNAVTGLATVNNGTLVTSSGGVPFFATTLPNAVQANITQLGTIASGAIPLGLVTGINATVANDLANPPNAASGVLIYGGAYGTPSSLGLANATGLPISTGLSGANSGALAALTNPVNASGGLLTYALIATSGGALPLLNANNSPSGAWQWTGGGPSVINLTSPPANDIAVSASGAILQVSPLTGGSLYTALYQKNTTLLDASKPEYFQLLDGYSNTGLAPNWKASTPFGASWTASTTWPALSYVKNAGNLYFSAAGGVGGATAPTCTSTAIYSTTCSDGGVTWTYLGAFGGIYVANAGNLYFSAAGGTSLTTAPTCGSGTCSDGSITWTYTSASIVANKVNGASSWVTGPNTAPGTWNWAFDSIWYDDQPFKTNLELDVTKNGTVHCDPGVLNCYNLLMGGGAYNRITAEIAMSAGASGHVAANWGLLMQGAYLAYIADIEIDDSAPVGLKFAGLYGASHSIATIDDLSSSPYSLLANGTYSVAPFASRAGASSAYGMFLGATAASGTSIPSQSLAFGYFDGSGAAQNITLIATPGAVTIGGSAGSPLVYAQQFITSNATYIGQSSISLTNQAASNVATMTNAPVAGNPTKWVDYNDNGTIRKLPLW